MILVWFNQVVPDIGGQLDQVVPCCALEALMPELSPEECKTVHEEKVNFLQYMLQCEYFLIKMMLRVKLYDYVWQAFDYCIEIIPQPI